MPKPRNGKKGKKDQAGTQATSNPICAATCDFQQCGILASEDPDEPLKPSFRLRNSKWC